MGDFRARVPKLFCSSQPCVSMRFCVKFPLRFFRRASVFQRLVARHLIDYYVSHANCIEQGTKTTTDGRSSQDAPEIEGEELR